MRTAEFSDSITTSEGFHPDANRKSMAHSGTMNESTASASIAATKATLAVHGTALAEDGPAPEWIELLPAGVFVGRDGRGPYRLSDPEAVIAGTRDLGMHAGIPIDYDHATDLAAPHGRPAPAAGWIRELAVRDGAIWGRVEWTRHGAAAVTTHEYRYISPVFEHGHDGEVVRLLRAALTNNPNLYLTAIAAARDASSDEADGLDGVLTQLAGELCAILGIDEGSSPDEIVDAVRALTEADAEPDAPGDGNSAGEVAAKLAEGAGADPSRFVPVAHFQQTLSELHTLRATRASERAENAVSGAIRAGKLVPAQREWALAYCAADYEGFETFVARQPALSLGESNLQNFARVPGARHAGIETMLHAAGGSLINHAEQQICSILGIAPDEFLERKNVQQKSSDAFALRPRRNSGGAAQA
jgi:phage I-like protein